MTQRSKTLGAIALVAAACLALTGCSKSNSGSPTASAQTTPSSNTAAAASTTTDSAEPQWDPCTIPDSAISGLGLDTSSKSNQVAGTTFDGWKVCTWGSTDQTYDFTIYTSSHSLNDWKQRTDYTDFTSITVGGHQALEYHSSGGNRDLECAISAQIIGGTVDFEVLNRYGAPNLGNPCSTVRHITDSLGQYLPQK